MDIRRLEIYASMLAQIDKAYWDFNVTGSLEPMKKLVSLSEYDEILLKRFHVSDTSELLQSMLLQKEFPEFKEKLSPTKPLFVYCSNYVPGNEVFGAEILYVLKGSFSYQSKSRERTLKEGYTYLFSPNYHSHTGNTPDSVCIGIVMSPTFLASSLFTSIPQNNIISTYFSSCLYTDYNNTHEIEFDTRDNETLRYYILRLMEEFTENWVFSEKIIATFPILIIYEMLRSRVNHYEDITSPNLNGNQMLDVIKYIQDNYQTITLQKTAEYFHFNPSYLSKLIKKLTGRTFLDIIHAAKMDQARTLLVHTNLSITEIAHEVGYSNVNHFYRLFSREFNCTPSVYRTRLANQTS